MFAEIKIKTRGDAETVVEALEQYLDACYGGDKDKEVRKAIKTSEKIVSHLKDLMEAEDKAAGEVEVPEGPTSDEALSKLPVLDLSSLDGPTAIINYTKSLCAGCSKPLKIPANCNLWTAGNKNVLTHLECKPNFPG